MKTLIFLTNDGRAKNTIKTVASSLKTIEKHADIRNPEEVKTYLAFAETNNATKRKHSYAYQTFCNVNGLKWNRPHYKVEEYIPLIPTTDNVHKIISASSRKYATIFTILAETGLEAHELATMQRKQIDAEKGIISAIGCKGHASRAFKLKQQTTEMLRAYMAKYAQEYPFPHAHIMGQIWREMRDRLSTTLQDAQLKNVTMRSLRNYSGAQFYYRIPDPIQTMRHLGHKRLTTTMHYLQAIVLDGEDECICKTAKTPDEAMKLIENGFQKADEIDGIHIYKKRK